MAIVRFETKDRARALGFLQAYYPSAKVKDEGPVSTVLDFVADDVFRIPDQSLHNGAIVASKNMTPEIMPRAVDALQKMHDALTTPSR